MALSLAFSPQAHLIADDQPDTFAAFPEALETAARLALEQGDGAVLLWLARFKTSAELPMPAVFWREFAGRYLTAFCKSGNPAPPAPETWLPFLEQTPPMKGIEFLTPEGLTHLWQRLDTTVRSQIDTSGVSAAEWIQANLPQWHLVGRVTFHLAENRKDPEHPFAFLATFTSGLNAEGNPRHLPLGQALKEFHAAQNKSGLLRLLEPVSLAAEQSDWIRDLADSGAIYRPQAWSPSQALQLLREVPVLERAGLSVRIPDWWKPNAPPRPQVTVTLSAGESSSFSSKHLLSFTIELTLDGEKLTQEELQAISTAEGLALVKGKWVEADAEKLQAVLEHWRKAQRMNFGNGIGFLYAMRMLAGAPIEGVPQQTLTPEIQDWTGLRAGPELESLLRRLRDPSQLPECGAPMGLRATLRPYQSEGVRWLRFMTELGLGACLADDMGLGKTIQILALLLLLKEGNSPPSLLIAPASLLANWKAEAEQFAPSLRILVAHPSGEDPIRFRSFAEGDSKALSGVDLVITTYGMVSRLEVLTKAEWRLLMLDEAQAIKNPNAAQSKAVKQLKGQTRIALTGTPVENRLADLWSLFDFLNPGLLGSAAAFARFVQKLGGEEGAHYGPLRKLVRPYILRRLKTDIRIIRDLPEKTEMTAWCMLTKPQAILYQQEVNRLMAALKESEENHRKGLILASLTAFKQICNHPAQKSGDSHFDPAESGKFLRLKELCVPIAERQERMLLFTQFTEIIPALRNYLRQLFGREGLVLTGQTEVKERRRFVEEFQKESGPPFFILSLKAGGTGLTLTAANHVVHFDRWWNPAVENQATDRAFRIGQRRNVLVHKFACRGTLEEKIDRLLTRKKDLSEGLLGGEEIALTQLSDEELLSFVTLDVNQIEQA